MERAEMNYRMGTKWFTFYTKIRPWLVCLGTLGTIVDFFIYMKLYFAFWWLLLSLVLSVAVAVLAIMVFVKSDYNYGDFVRFVRALPLTEEEREDIFHRNAERLLFGCDKNSTL